MTSGLKTSNGKSRHEVSTFIKKLHHFITFTHTKMHLIRILISPSAILRISSEYPV